MRVVEVAGPAWRVCPVLSKSALACFNNSGVIIRAIFDRKKGLSTGTDDKWDVSLVSERKLLLVYSDESVINKWSY